MKEKSPVIVRNFEQCDRLNVVTLIEESGLADDRPSGYVQGMIDKRTIYVADSIGSVVGTVFIDEPTKHQTANIRYVAVHENFRGLGIGKTLMNHAESILRNMNIKAINLLAHDSKPELINFYGNLGFVLVTPDGEMVKRL